MPGKRFVIGVPYVWLTVFFFLPFLILLYISFVDMGNDIDDALAFDLIYKAMDDGRVDLLAIGNHKLSPTATDYIDILNTWYGYPDIPLAQSPTPVLNGHAPDYTAAVCAMTREDGSPAFARSKTPEQIEDPVTLYRRTLAAQPDCSVTVLSLGFATELAKLLDSPADDISPLTGRELVARKVKTLSIMAGSYELGKQVMYPGAAIENDFGWAKLHPVVEGYKNYHKMPYDRASWDLLSVVYLLHPEYFTESEPGTVAVDDKGFTNFTPGPDGRHRWLTATPEQLTRLRDCIVRTTTRAPKHTEL